MFINKNMGRYFREGISSCSENQTIVGYLAYFGALVRNKDAKRALEIYSKNFATNRNADYLFLNPGNLEAFKEKLSEEGLLLDPENFTNRDLKKVKKGLYAQAIRMIFCSDFFGHASAVKILNSLPGDYLTDSTYGISLSNTAINLGILTYGRYSYILTPEEREESIQDIEDIIRTLEGSLPENILEQYEEFKRYMVSGEFDTF